MVRRKTPGSYNRLIQTTFPRARRTTFGYERAPTVRQPLALCNRRALAGERSRRQLSASSRRIRAWFDHGLPTLFTPRNTERIHADLG